MPLPASEIRARGDRIRRRRHAAIAGVGAAAVAAVAVPVIALTAGGSDRDNPPVAPEPTGTDSVPAPTLELSKRNLLTGADAIYPNGGGDWRTLDTYRGDGQATMSICQQSSFAGLGAEDVYVRTFEFTSEGVPGVDPSLLFAEAVAQFPDEATAAAAYDEVQAWYDDCPANSPDKFSGAEAEPVGIDVEGTAESRLLTSFGEKEDVGTFLEAGFVLSGNRIALLNQEVPGQDYNWPRGTPVEQMLPVAAERLVLGNGAGGSTLIPPDFPLTSGWPEDDGSDEHRLDPPSADNQGMIPAGELEACVFSPVDPGAVDRTTARLSDGSDGYVRELQLFPADQGAAAYLDQLGALYEGCPTEDQNGAPPTFTTEVGEGAIGDESVVITRASDGIGRVVINVVRVGNAVVVDLASDEGAGDTVGDLATVTRENLADVVGAMNDLRGGGVSGNPGTADPNAPAATTAIPEDFPLASYPGEPPTADSETTITGPEPGLEAVGDLPICGVAPLPTEPVDRLGYSVAGIEYGDVRELRTYPTAQAAVGELQSLRDRLAACDREPTEQDGWSRVWHTYGADTGYDSVTFGYTTEMDDSDSFAPSGQLMTAVRVGSSILIIGWYAEYSAESMADNVPNLLDTVALVTPAMCAFTADGC